MFNVNRHNRVVHRRGLTLLESLFAAAILAMIVIAVTSAITAGQQHAYEAQQRIASTLAAEALMGDLMTEEYESLPTWQGYREEVGQMRSQLNDPMPPAFDGVGREVSVTNTLQEMPGLDVRVGGRLVRVWAFNANGRVLADLYHFVPEPSDAS